MLLREILACNSYKNIFRTNYTKTLSTDSKWTDSKNHSALKKRVKKKKKIGFKKKKTVKQCQSIPLILVADDLAKAVAKALQDCGAVPAMSVGRSLQGSLALDFLPEVASLDILAGLVVLDFLVGVVTLAPVLCHFRKPTGVFWIGSFYLLLLAISSTSSVCKSALLLSSSSIG